MKKPNQLTVRVMGRDVPILKDDIVVQAANNLGEYRIQRNQIAIDSQVEQQLQGAVLIHEIVEVLNFDLELKLQHEILSSLASALYQVIRDNPQLIKQIISGKGLVV